MGNIGIGLELLLVGMLTVFAILLIVIYGGKLMIRLCNRIFPEEKQGRKAASEDEDFTTVRPVLEAAVSQITGGKGHIVRITKQNEK